MIYTIERDNKNVTAFTSGTEAEATGLPVFTSPAKLTEITKDWPTAELVELWNSLPGAKPTKKFTDRATAISRIWTRLNVALEPHAAPQAAQEAPAAPKPRKKATLAEKRERGDDAPRKHPSKAKALAKLNPANGSKRDQVIAMISAKGGATLDAIMTATDWQRHTVRGFIATLGTKLGYVIDSTKVDGERVYAIRKG